MGQKPYRVKQTMEWIYKQRISHIEEMSNLPANLREHLSQSYHLNNLEHIETKGAADTTRKFLFRLHDGRYVETVFIPASVGLKGKQSSRKTICVSSQVGCAYGCKFCASGLAGFTRNLLASEIIGQMLSVEKISGQPINNIVFMGMGEPMANYNAVLRTIRNITAPAQDGFGISARSVTLSTVGLVSGIEKLIDENIKKFTATLSPKTMSFSGERTLHFKS